MIGWYDLKMLQKKRRKKLIGKNKFAFKLLKAKYCIKAKMINRKRKLILQLLFNKDRKRF